MYVYVGRQAVRQADMQTCMQYTHTGEGEKVVDLPEFGTLLLQYTHGNSTLQTDAHDLLVEKVLHFKKSPRTLKTLERP